MSGSRIYPRHIMEREIARLERRLRGEPEPVLPEPTTYTEVYLGREILVIKPSPGFKLERALEGDGPLLWKNDNLPGVFGRVGYPDE